MLCIFHFSNNEHKWLQLDSNPVWPNGWVFVYELSGSAFKSSCSHLNLNFRFHYCFEQGVPWHSGNYRVWIHSETRTWHEHEWYDFWNLHQINWTQAFKLIKFRTKLLFIFFILFFSTDLWQLLHIQFDLPVENLSQIPVWYFKSFNLKTFFQNSNFWHTSQMSVGASE